MQLYGTYRKCHNLYRYVHRHEKECQGRGHGRSRLPKQRTSQLKGGVPSASSAQSDGARNAMPKRPLSSIDHELPVADENRSEPLLSGTQSGSLLDWGVEDIGPSLDALDGITLVRLSLFTWEVLRKEHRALFALRLRHATVYSSRLTTLRWSHLTPLPQPQPWYSTWNGQGSSSTSL